MGFGVSREHIFRDVRVGCFVIANSEELQVTIRRTIPDQGKKNMPCLVPQHDFIGHSWNPPRNTGPLIFSVVPECYSDFCCSAVMFLSQARSEIFYSCEFCCVTWAQSNQSGLSFIVFCHCAKWPLLRMGGRRCRTHVASLSKSDTACPSYA